MFLFLKQANFLLSEDSLAYKLPFEPDALDRWLLEFRTGDKFASLIRTEASPQISSCDKRSPKLCTDHRKARIRSIQSRHLRICI